MDLIYGQKPENTNLNESTQENVARLAGIKKKDQLQLIMEGRSYTNIDIGQAKVMAQRGEVVSASDESFFKAMPKDDIISSAEIEDEGKSIIFNLKGGGFVEVEIDSEGMKWHKWKERQKKVRFENQQLGEEKREIPTITEASTRLRKFARIAKAMADRNPNFYQNEAKWADAVEQYFIEKEDVRENDGNLADDAIEMVKRGINEEKRQKELGKKPDFTDMESEKYFNEIHPDDILKHTFNEMMGKR